MPYLEVLNGPEVGQKVELRAETFFIGRDPNNHLLLTDRTVSRKHAVINLIEGRHVLSDLKSLKGVLVNGVKRAEATLESGDEIALGAVRIRFVENVKAEKSLSLSQTQNRSTLKILLGFFLFLLLIVGGFWFGQRRVPPLKPAPDLAILKVEYERGLTLFNRDHDIEGAKQAWREVLAQDPNRETVYGKKAAKLLENLRE